MNRSAYGILAMVFAIIIGVVGSGCGQSSAPGASHITSRAADGPLTIIMVPKQSPGDYWETLRQGAQCAASKLTGVTVTWSGTAAETDVVGQIALLQKFIAQRPDGIIYAATDAKQLANESDQAMRSHIPVINIDSGTNPQPETIPLFATDNTMSARKAADIMAQRLHNQGNIGVIDFQPGSVTNDQRVQGFTQELAKYANMHIVAEESSNSDVTTAEHVTQALLALHPELTGIFAANMQSAVGAAQAVSAAGLAGKVQIVGWDSSPQEIQALQAGVITELVVQNPFRMGYDSVMALVKQLRQNVATTNEDTGVTFISKDTLITGAVQALLNPSCATPPLNS